MPLLPDIEPMMPQDRALEHSEIPALATELMKVGGRLEGALHPISAQVVEAHIRMINSYYSNLIEGHDTRPHDIKKAMMGEYSEDPAKRGLQLESLAHIGVQRWMSEAPPDSDRLMTEAYLRQIHQVFYDQLPVALRVLEGAEGDRLTVAPGQLRPANQGVRVGHHMPPSGEEISRYLDRFFEAYRPDRLPAYKHPIAAMAAHHRLLWIHPFLDGNGRVARLFTDAYLRAIGIGGHGIWCLSRGLARQHAAYKQHLAKADQPRKGDRDGRGQRSEGELIALIEFMLTVAVDQAGYMQRTLDLKGMFDRIQAYVRDRNSGLVEGVGAIKPEATRLIERAFVIGEIPRSEVHSITGLGRATSRKLVQQLKAEGLLSETSSRSPLRWAIPEHAERYYFPQLSPP